jgi:putative transposase
MGMLCFMHSVGDDHVLLAALLSPCLHLVWATQGRMPLIAAELEAPLFRIMVDRGNTLGAITFAVNGLPDHVHLVVAIPPTIALSEYVRQVKGASSHYAHTEL